MNGTMSLKKGEVVSKVIPVEMYNKAYFSQQRDNFKENQFDKCFKMAVSWVTLVLF